MTVSTTVSKKVYAGNGVTTAFATTFQFFANTDLIVSIVVDSTGVETVKTLTTHYTVTGGSGATGTVTMITAPATGETLVIKRSTPYTQSTDYAANDSFPADAHETALDRATVLAQQAYSEALSSPVLPATFEPGVSTRPTIPLPVANKVLMGNSGATGWTGVTLSDQVTIGGLPIAITAAAAGDILMHNGTVWVDATTLTGNYTFSGRVDTAKSANVASASSIDLSVTTGNFTIITGTTPITALGTVQAGARRLVQTQSALTFTHNGTSLILPNGYDVNTFAGEFLEFLSLGSGNWQLVSPRPDIGDVKYRSTAAAPSGWLLMDGSAVSRTTYSGLFKLLVTDQAYSGQTFTVTIASPGVFTKATHGFSNGERVRLATTGALPTGLDTTTDYFVTIVDANTFKVSSSRANYLAGTFVNTSGSQSGTHTYTQSLYGLGDGSTTFNLPDLRDTFIRGRAASGRTIGSLQTDANKAHTHDTPYRIGTLAGGAGGGDISGASPDGLKASTSAGGTEARPVNLAGYPLIKF